MQLAVDKNHLDGQLLYKSPEDPRKNGVKPGSSVNSRKDVLIFPS